MSTITFETKCWEGDWVYLLRKGYIERMIDNANYPFDCRILYINNVDDVGKVKRIAQNKIDKGVIDKYVIVEDHAAAALKFFDINKDDFNGGYYYSIAELVSIYLCETDFLLHFSSDALIEKDHNKWVEKSMNLLLENDDILVSNPAWDNNLEGIKRESEYEIEDFYIGYGFSDQSYLVRTKDMKRPIYNETNIQSERYPEYGGELFEKRVDAYMRNHNKLRATCKKTSYIHKNFKKLSFLRKLIGV